MRFFKRKPPQIRRDFQLIKDWEIATQMSDGVVATLHGHVSGYPDGEDAAEWVRYVRAIRDGLRAAGFESEVTLSRTVREELDA